MKHKNTLHSESYLVLYDIKQSNGFWTMNLEMTIDLHGLKSIKNNHDLACSMAEKMIKEKHPNRLESKITRVIYC